MAFSKKSVQGPRELAAFVRPTRLKGWLLHPCCDRSLPDPAGLQLAQVCQTH